MRVAMPKSQEGPDSFSNSASEPQAVQLDSVGKVTATTSSGGLTVKGSFARGNLVRGPFGALT